MYCRHSEPGIHLSGNRNNISDRLQVYLMLKIYSDDVFKKKHSMEKIFFFPCIFFPCLIFTLFNKLQRIESAEILFFFYIFRNLRLSEQSLPRVSTSRGKKSQTRNDIVSETQRVFCERVFYIPVESQFNYKASVASNVNTKMSNCCANIQTMKSSRLDWTNVTGRGSNTVWF